MEHCEPLLAHAQDGFTGAGTGTEECCQDGQGAGEETRKSWLVRPSKTEVRMAPRGYCGEEEELCNLGGSVGKRG